MTEEDKSLVEGLMNEAASKFTKEDENDCLFAVVGSEEGVYVNLRGKGSEVIKTLAAVLINDEQIRRYVCLAVKAAELNGADCSLKD